MDFKHIKDSSFTPHEMETGLEEGPYADPLCKLNLKETSDFVRTFPVAPRYSLESIDSPSTQRRRGIAEVPTTPGRPLFNVHGGVLARRSVPSKWDDADKWLMNTSSCRESPAHLSKQCHPPKITNHGEASVERRVGIGGCNVHGSFFNASHLEHRTALHRLSLDVPLKDKFTDNVELIFPSFQYSEPSRESFLFENSIFGTRGNAATGVMTGRVHCRDVGTETTPRDSSTNSRCHTPKKDSSPSRHNTPADCSGILMPPKTSVDVLELSDCHFAKLNSAVSNWSSREEEEEEISKSLRHFEMGGEEKSVVEYRALAWEDERRKSCTRYQREEAKIQAWLNLHNAKAEAQSRKLEVKIQKMKANLEEKLIKRMTNAHKRAEEWRAKARLQHMQEVERASAHAGKTRNQYGIHQYGHAKCGCFL